MRHNMNHPLADCQSSISQRQKESSAENGGVEAVSSRALRKLIVSVMNPLRRRAIELRKSVQGVCYLVSYTVPTQACAIVPYHKKIPNVTGPASRRLSHAQVL
ncbi:unnamed protein product [Ectocarpus sp. 4 AP-2014]